MLVSITTAWVHAARRLVCKDLMFSFTFLVAELIDLQNTRWRNYIIELQFNFYLLTPQKKRHSLRYYKLALTQLPVQVQVAELRYNAEPLIRFHPKIPTRQACTCNFVDVLNETKKAKKEKPFEFHCF